MRTLQEAFRVDGYTVNPHSEHAGCCTKKLAMCYSEPTECSKNPAMFDFAPPVFKEPMKYAKTTRV